MFQTLLHFFHMKGEGLSVEDMKSGDYKVGLLDYFFYYFFSVFMSFNLICLFLSLTVLTLL